MGATGPDVAVEGQNCATAEGAGAVPPALAEDPGDLVLVEVDVGDLEARHLRQSHPGVDEQPEDGGIAPIGKALALVAGGDVARWSSAERIATGCSGTLGGRILAIGSTANSSSSVSHLKNCCSDR